MEPALEVLKLVIYLAQDALNGSKRGVADGCSVEDQNKSSEISRDQNQLIDVLDLNWN